MTTSLWSPICIKWSFPLCLGSSECFVCFYDTRRLSGVLVEFIFCLKTTLLIHCYTQTGLINRTHSLQTKPPYSPNRHANVSFLCLRETTSTLGPKAPALIVVPDRVPLHPDGRPVIRPNPRLSAPAAGAAEWLHYMAWCAWRVNGECVLIFTSDSAAASAAPSRRGRNIPDNTSETQTGSVETDR